MIATARLCLASVVLCAALPVGAQTGTAPAKPRALNIEAVTNTKFTGDFDQMLERRHIRFAAPYSRTLFYSDKGRERGLTAELAREFEQYVNRKYAKQLGKRPFTVILIPSTRTELIEDVANGLADIGAGNLSVTEARLQKVDMVAPEDLKAMSEVLLTGPKSPAVATIDDLAGKTIHLRPSSSYYESVTRLSERFRKEGKPPVTIIKLPDALEDEDIMEMLNAGLLQFAVVDDWKAKIWAQILPNVKVREDIVLASGTRPGWAIRKGSPKLRAELEEFYTNYVKKQGTHAYRVTQLQKRVKQIGNNTADAERKRFNDTLALFQKYGPKYGFDPVMLAAQGYQESQLRQDARSHVGAIGIMQIMPATGKDLKVGDITVAEANVHGGAKYMDQLMTLYFKDANFSPTNRSLFAFASYNAGPGRIAQMRKEAEKRGLDPNLWFNNVEIVTAEKVGIETTTYVRNIYKYYVSYTLLLESQDDVKKAREAVKAPAK